MSIFSNLTDSVTGKSLFIDGIRNLRAESTKRILGSSFGATIDTTYLYTVTNANAGAATAANSVLTLATNTTASGSSSIQHKKKARYMSGRSNIFRSSFRFGDTGVTGNVREFGVYIDASNKIVYRLSGTTVSVVVQRAGVETVVASGAFNGNGLSTGGTYTLDTNFHTYEILYTTTAIRFIVDDTALHTFKPTTTSLIVGMVGTLYASNVNTTIATNQVLDCLTWSISHIGDAVNNPIFWNDNTGTVQAGLTIKSGGGTLQCVSIGALGGSNATLTIYDNTAAGGTLIQKFDLSAPGALGTHILGVEGVNFYTGLTYATTGTLTGASFTFFYE